MIEMLFYEYEWVIMVKTYNYKEFSYNDIVIAKNNKTKEVLINDRFQSEWDNILLKE